MQAAFAHPARNAQFFPITEGDRVADFGAGAGHYVYEIARILGGSGRVYAIDVQQDLLRRIKNESARRGWTNVETVWADIERPYGSTLASGSVRLVLMSNVLFQLQAPRDAFGEAHRILTPLGRLIVIDWSDSYEGMGPPKQQVFWRGSAIEVARDAGFLPEGQFDAGTHHYGLVFKKDERGLRAQL